MDRCRRERMEPETRRHECRSKTRKAGDEAGDRGAGKHDSEGRGVERCAEHELSLAELPRSLKRPVFRAPFTGSICRRLGGRGGIGELPSPYGV